MQITIIMSITDMTKCNAKSTQSARLSTLHLLISRTGYSEVRLTLLEMPKKRYIFPTAEPV